MRQYIYIIIGLLSCLFLLSGCHRVRPLVKKVPLSVDQETKQQHIELQAPPITVVIHGTKLFMRSFYQKNFGAKPGLKHASTLPKGKFSYEMLKKLSECDPTMFSYEYMYYFGWSGFLSTKARDEAAESLYDSLVELADTYYKRYQVQPIIRLIGHSHGGNLALSLARFHAKKKKNLSIDSVIILACPVQRSFAQFVTSSLFKNIYSFYACLDFIQVIAPEIMQYRYDDSGELIEKKWLGYLYSGQCFRGCDSVKQARIKMNNHTITHSDFFDTKFLCTLPQLLRAVDNVYVEHSDEIKCCRRELLCTIR